MSPTSHQRPIAERFREAVQQNDAATLRDLLPHRDELRDVINAPTFAFDSPALVTISGRGNIELVDALLQLGADPNRKSDWWAGGFHALYGASPEVAARLLDAGATPDACAAAHLDRADLLESMISANPACVHERGGDGQTPLHFARSRAVVDLLLDAGADIDARDVDHRATAAEWMLGDADNPKKSRLELARYLVGRGASCDIFLAAALGDVARIRTILAESPQAFSLRTGQGMYGDKPPSSYHIYFWTIGGNLTPLQAAARFNQHAALDAMLQCASPTQRLVHAAQAGDRDTALDIIAKNPGIIDSLSADDHRSLTDAASSSNAEAVELMLELGFDPSIESISGPHSGTALHCAAWEGSVACVEALLRYQSGRALLRTKDRAFGGTPLAWCHHGAQNCGNPRANHAKVEALLLRAAAASA